MWIDANTALGIAAASSSTSTNSSSVQVVTKSPPAVETATRTLISVPPSSVGVARSNGFGYLLAQDDPKNQSCSVYIFAPSVRQRRIRESPHAQRMSDVSYGWLIASLYGTTRAANACAPLSGVGISPA